MEENLSQYKCPNCSAPLTWSPKRGKLYCSACGSEFEADGTLAGSREVEKVETFDWGAYRKGLDHQTLEGMKVYNCVSCGAVIEADENTAATKCPYCGNNVILNDKLTGGLRPNGIIPFRITSEELPAAVRKFYHGKRLLPRNFFSDQRLGKVQGIYVPFWLYDCRIQGPANFEGTRTRSYTEGDYECIETSYYMLERDGEMGFSRLPVDGSVKMDDDLMDSLEPFDYRELVDFKSDYLTGYLADRFDDDPDVCLPRASRRVKNSAEEVIRGTCPGYETVRMASSGLQVADASVRYVLLPVYLFHSEYAGKSYRYAVNGQTGKVVGELPVSRGKSLGIFGAIFAGVGALLFALLNGGGWEALLEVLRWIAD